MTVVDNMANVLKEKVKDQGAVLTSVQGQVLEIQSTISNMTVEFGSIIEKYFTSHIDVGRKLDEISVLVNQSSSRLDDVIQSYRETFRLTERKIQEGVMNWNLHLKVVICGYILYCMLLHI